LHGAKYQYESEISVFWGFEPRIRQSVTLRGQGISPSPGLYYGHRTTSAKDKCIRPCL